MILFRFDQHSAVMSAYEMDEVLPTVLRCGMVMQYAIIRLVFKEPKASTKSQDNIRLYYKFIAFTCFANSATYDGVWRLCWW